MALKPLVTKPEATLVGLDDGRKLAKFRAIDDSGASITATPEQIAAALAEQNILAGPAGPAGPQGDTGPAGPIGPAGPQGPAMDYSKLEEQIIPGEFWMDMSGAKKQVYTKSFLGRTPSSAGSNMTLSIGSNYTLLSFNGYIETFSGDGSAENMPINFGGTYNWKYYGTKVGIEVQFPAGSTNVINKRFVITVKYAK